MRRAFYISLMLAASLSGFNTSAAEPALHELSRDQAPYWDVVSIKGLNEHLIEIHESATLLASNISLDEFLKPRGIFQIHGASQNETEEAIHLIFNTCSTYKMKIVQADEVTTKKTFIQLRACWNQYSQKDGQDAFLSNHSVYDDFVMPFLKKVTNYRLSDDGQTLTVLDLNGESLGVFSRREAVQ